MGTLETTSYEDLKKVFAIDTFSIFLTCKYVLPYMKKQGGGTIVNTIGSMRFAMSRTSWATAARRRLL